jgi:hypothetical protein
MRTLPSFLLLVAVHLVVAHPVSAADAGIDFFEQKIRPVLVAHCYQCHSAGAKKLKGGLLLDSRAGIRKGGDSGPAVVPGKPNESLLLKAVRYTDENLRMPPKGKLPDAVLADLRTWVAMGAPDPRDDPATKSTASLQAARKHWAYQPIRKPGEPVVKQRHWATTPIDLFILAQLEAKGLTPSPPADRRTLLRRAYYDLIGLPPTGAEVEAFENDQSPEAFAKVVDQLLASPHYGERWGRHWLDVARYADTKDGVLMYGDSRLRPYAYTYRDYVVRALNEDLPFDRFVHEQLAADQIEPKVEPWHLAAMGFLTLGRMFDNNIHDVLDDRIDTVSRGLLGLTVACARCHDHKYDAIPTADYYSLYGVFASSEPPFELPLIDRSEKLPGCAEFESQAGPKRRALQQFLDSQYALLREAARQKVGDYLVKVATSKPDPLETAIFFLSLAPADLRPQITARWRRYLERRGQPDDPVLGPWHDLMQLPEATFSGSAKGVVEHWKARPTGTAPGQINPLVHTVLVRATLANRGDVARLYGGLLRRVYEIFQASKRQAFSRELLWSAALVAALDSGGATKAATNAALQRSSRLNESVPAGWDPEAFHQLLEIVIGSDSPCYFPKGHTWAYMSRGEKDSFGQKQTELDVLAAKSPYAPPRAMVLYDAEEIVEPHVFVRGNAAQPGQRIPRQFLAVLSSEPRQPFRHGSGRLDLAHAITAPDNPLTSRVLANRVWMHLFGEPLVQTPNDFGTRSSPPSHPELLDYLAWTLQHDGWSLKKLHRQILLSSTYRQASFDRPACRKIDPENRLYWRANRRRLDLEAMRDTLLAVACLLDPKVGGRPVDLVGDSRCRRRTLYGLVDRQSLPALYRAFDFASPDQSAERRPQTTVPQQALFGMNSPFVIEQAMALGARPEVAGEPDPARRVEALYRLVLARAPDRSEVASALRFVTRRMDSEPSQLTAWQAYSQVLLLTNEAMFVD